MVGSGDLKVYKSTNGLGGPITSTQIPSATFNNMFPALTRAEQAAGKDEYGCMYLKNTHPNEAMQQFKLWLGTDTIPVDTTVKWGLEPPIASGYRWSPSFVSTGSNKEEIADAVDNRLTVWTISAWFKTSAAPTPDEGWILNKGGSGSETAGENQMYALWMSNTGTIRAGFETNAGVDNYVTSPLTYHNGAWHWAMAMYDGTTVSLFVDNATTPVATLATTSTPEASTKPVRINQNSRASNGWFPSGAELDEIRLWNRALTDVDERTELYTNNTVNSVGLIIERKFGEDNAFSDIAQVIPNSTTPPTGVTWRTAGIKPSTPTIQSFKNGRAFPVWVWWHNDVEAVTRKDDACFFNFALTPPIGGTGDQGTGGGGGGGGSGGTSFDVDIFGSRKIYKDKSGGRTWNSNWHTATSHEWSPLDDDHDYGVALDPQDNMVDLITKQENIARVDSVSKTLTADSSTNRNTLRLWVKDPTATQSSSPWKWSESIEATIYYKVLGSFSGNDVHVHVRLVGPSEHWLAIQYCPASGHNYGFEIKANGVIQLRKEELHINSDPDGYARNIESSTNDAPTNKDIGIKLCTIKEATGKVRVEGWRDLTNGQNGGTWIKMVSFTDDGTNWKLSNSGSISDFNGEPAGTGNCVKISPIDRALDMPCSAVGLRCDGQKVQFKKWSVREIDPNDPGSGGSGGSSGGGGTGGGTGGNPPPTPSDYKICAVGDWGCENATDDVISLINREGYQYIVGLGDNAYESASCWTNRMKPWRDAGKTNMCYGNHEYSESGGINPYKTFFSHTKTYFTYKFQNILFINIDVNIDIDPGGTQHNWVIDQLNAADSDSTIDWRIAVMHQQWFGGSSSHSHNEFNQVQAFMDLFIQHKVAFVLVGHLHNWQRTYQVKRTLGASTSPTVTANTSPYTVNNVGLIHVISGTGGHDSGSSLYGIGTQPAFNAFQSRVYNGVWEMIASNNGKTLTCSFVNTDGDRFDTFVINSA